LDLIDFDRRLFAQDRDPDLGGLGGRRSVGGGRRSTVDGRRSTVGGRRSAVDGRRSAVGGRRSAVGGRSPRLESESVVGSAVASGGRYRHR
jgi:hypothetical protein